MGYYVSLYSPEIVTYVSMYLCIYVSYVVKNYFFF